jgi:ribose transport system ATP-binding protein/putative multiple sugar transport system ATP-binding protein
MTSAEPEELLAVSDRVVAMAGGRVVGEVARGASLLELVTLVAPL